MNHLIFAVFIGVGATAMMDLWGLLRKPLFGIAPPDYGLVGRWLGHMAHGQFHHAAITAAPLVRGERVLGWVFHYVTGIVFAMLLIGICGFSWVRQPSVAPALFVGLCTVAAPFLLMQPGMGAGIAAAKTPRPGFARLQSLVTHAIFGFGLYASAWVLNLFS